MGEWVCLLPHVEVPPLVLGVPMALVVSAAAFWLSDGKCGALSSRLLGPSPVLSVLRGACSLGWLVCSLSLPLNALHFLF